MSQFKVALLQMIACGNDQAANQAKGEDFCRRASAMGADIALFPEMWNVGYTPVRPWDSSFELWRGSEQWLEGAAKADESLQLSELWQGQAIGRDDPFIAHFQALAKELGMAIAITYLERWDGFPRNSVSIIDRRGEILMTYAKLHTCDWSANEAAITPGDDFSVCTLETNSGEVQVGAMICYDREFPESARILMLKGAEIILTPNGCDLELHRLGQFRARADENIVGVAMANYAGSRMGHSVAYDPIAFDTEGSRDNLVIEAGESEGIYLAIFEMDQIRDYRRCEAWGNSFRRPHRYGAITSTEVKEPFVRVNGMGERYDTTKR
ncbi:MAG: carbon-nitrogen hydrolase family protein [Chloroflexota bacterium]|nr:MAG: carbon-nitrogen hydrolase family protein [Chloroflexota bacterium]